MIPKNGKLGITLSLHFPYNLNSGLILCQPLPCLMRTSLGLTSYQTVRYKGREIDLFQPINNAIPIVMLLDIMPTGYS
jgi:hypothetical protein